ncbi:sesquipedalian-1 isoform X2 [Perca fluviatilis]|uniref:sesquipedalian-1 isoform X2 n=1 Tax=Perca fluviatilis TaxID=8168 RepID=UPI0019630899|nr:sesquipedalian-1 isoform X2 [Perca fluviatilis]
MKLHEKILTHYLSCTSPVDKEGYLYKKKERNATYQRRWFVLKANLLFYQDRPADRHLLGVIVLEGCAVRHSEPDGQFAFSLVFEGPGLKTYRFAAGDGQTQESWVKALLSASHCYLSLLVRDLGRQYEGVLCGKLNSNKALVNPVPAPLSVLSNSPPPTSSSLCKGQQQWSGWGEASVPGLFYRHHQYPLKWWRKSPQNCGPGEMLTSHHLMDRHLCMGNGLWWILIHLRTLANFMIIMARK